ncbi:hypothetical protein WSS15_23160 [Acetobacter pasteurianus]|uniref:Hint domain-containing protein n=1 Tax=Acetobacter pasteurianus TaxID=438 RepID=UPI0022C1412B|nr:Hint domain-containing protein [Acetobacter pasteurianus]GLH29666.1 hypothetical protein WSS15_23160 [Acetobacter pasteurianus]
MTTPDWSTGSDYTWVGPTTGGVWTDASNWQYDGEPATHAPDAQTSGTITIPAGATVTIPSTVSSLGYLTLDVQGTLVMPSSDSQLTFSKLVVENGGQATISRTLNINGGLQINNGGTATFEGVTQNWTNPSLNLSLLQGGTLNIDKSNIVLGNVNQGSGAGTLNITGGSVVSTASNSTDSSGPINVTGSSFTDNSSLASTTTLTLNDGATATLSTSAYPADGSTVVFGTGNNTLVLPNLQYGANKVNVENLKNGDRLGVDGTQVTTATLSANNVALATTSGTPIQVKSVTYDSSYTDAPTGDETQTVTIDSGQGVICFLAGSMIATPNGVVAVENIRRGDEVLTFVNGRTQHHHGQWDADGKLSGYRQPPQFCIRWQCCDHWGQGQKLGRTRGRTAGHRPPCGRTHLACAGRACNSGCRPYFRPRQAGHHPQPRAAPCYTSGHGYSAFAGHGAQYLLHAACRGGERAPCFSRCAPV